jgi:hypothetical protein
MGKIITIDLALYMAEVQLPPYKYNSREKGEPSI